MCQGNERFNCRPFAMLCMPDHSYSFDFSDPSNHLQILLADLVDAVTSTSQYSSSSQFLLDPVHSLPIAFATGDLNLDSYADILSILSDSMKTSRPVVFQNVPCSVESCSAGAVSRGRRTLQIWTDGVVGVLDAVTGVVRATFVDLDDKVSARCVHRGLTRNSSRALWIFFCRSTHLQHPPRHLPPYWQFITTFSTTHSFSKCLVRSAGTGDDFVVSNGVCYKFCAEDELKSVEKVWCWFNS